MGNGFDPAKAHDFTVINPANEEPIATISLGSSADVDRAVAAAKRAFESYSETTPDERLALLRRIIEVYQSKMDEMAETISLEMGAPISLSRKAQAPAGLGHLAEIVKVLEHFKFEELKGSTLMRKEPIGVCGLITPWNWPMNQIVSQGGAGPRGGVHHGSQAERNGTALRLFVRADSARSWRSAWCFQSGEWRRAYGGRCDCVAS